MAKFDRDATAKQLAALRAEGKKAWEELYVRHARPFMNWADKRFEGSDFESAWQDALIIFVDKLRKGKLVALDCEVVTYLFAVGNNVLLNQQRKTKLVVRKDEVDEVCLRYAHLLESEDNMYGEEREVLYAAMRSLSKRCRLLLVLRDIAGLNLAEIAAFLAGEDLEREWLSLIWLESDFPSEDLDKENLSEYAGKNSLSATISKCYKRLEDLIRGK